VHESDLLGDRLHRDAVLPASEDPDRRDARQDRQPRCGRPVEPGYRPDRHLLAAGLEDARGVEQHPGGDRITEDYAQLIAVDVAYAYFTNLSKTLRNALQNETGKSGPDAVAAAEKILVRLNEIEQEARDMLRAEYQKGMQVVELSRSLQLLHQSLNAGMPTNIFQSMMVFNR
jgi:hypothetical protein